MGRYYYGDIEGKFWVGVQSSGDICELIDIEPNNTYLWKICLCSADICSQDNVLSLYCKDCYKSRDEQSLSLPQSVLRPLIHIFRSAYSCKNLLPS